MSQMYAVLLQVCPQPFTQTVKLYADGACAESHILGDGLDGVAVVVAAEHDGAVLGGEGCQEGLQGLPQGQVIHGIGGIGIGQALGQLVQQDGTFAVPPLCFPFSEAGHGDIAGHAAYVSQEGARAVGAEGGR